MKDDCVFCAFIHGDAPKPDKYGLAIPFKNVVHFEPLNPVTPGHMLFVPIQHVESVLESPFHGGEVAFAAFHWAKYQGGQYNFITSAGPAATQTVFHMHIHAVPRREGDGLKLPWTEG